MKYLERHLVTVYGKQAFLDWIISVKPELHRWDLEILNYDPSGYLIEVEDQSCHGEILKVHYLQIFEEELGNIVGRDQWPEDRSYSVFCSWFSIRYHTCVADMLQSD